MQSAPLRTRSPSRRAKTTRKPAAKALTRTEPTRRAKPGESPAAPKTTYGSVKRPPSAGPNAYGINIGSDCIMEPAAVYGDCVIVDPDVQAEPGDMVVIWPIDGAAPYVRYLVSDLAFLRAHLGKTMAKGSDGELGVIFQTSNPQKQGVTLVSKIKAIHRVIGVYREEPVLDDQLAAAHAAGSRAA